MWPPGDLLRDGLRDHGPSARVSQPLRSRAEAFKLSARTTRIRLYGAAKESNLPSVGLQRRTGFEGLPDEAQSASEAAFRAPPQGSKIQLGALRSVQSSVQSAAPAAVGVNHVRSRSHRFAAERIRDGLIQFHGVPFAPTFLPASRCRVCQSAVRRSLQFASALDIRVC
jgi:hypothetical protein